MQYGGMLERGTAPLLAAADWMTSNLTGLVDVRTGDFEPLIRTTEIASVEES
jgi:hypothetical protein